MSIKAQEIKVEIDVWDYAKPKSICIAKETINTVKIQCAE
jgi:hypothetical protein